MREREIFLAALELDDPAARQAYLSSACAGRPGLRERVEALLRSHAEADDFLGTPAMEQLAAAEAALPFLGPSPDAEGLGRLGHYQVLDVVGRGATGVVLKALDTKLQRVVAIKVLCSQLAGNQAARTAFVREAQAAAAVRDDHVVAIHAVSDEGPVTYLVMEFIGGVTLEDRVRRAGKLDLKEVLRIGTQVAKGLAAAHAQGLVHRDIKPANILLENGVERVKIADFGLARAAKADWPVGGQSIVGTPLFMSPEQARGDPVDQRSDLFSLGSVLYWLCAGRAPFQGETTGDVLRRVCEDRPQPIRESGADIPDWLCGLISKLHAKEAGARFARAQEVADLLGHHLALAQQPSGLALRRRRRRWFFAGLVGVLVAAIALAALGNLAKWWDRRVPGDDPAEDTFSRYTGPVVSLDLRRDDISPAILALAGDGDTAKAPAALAAVLGDGPFHLPRSGSSSWMEQSPDGRVLAVPLDEDVVLFSTPGGEYLRSLKGPGGRVVNVAFTRDNRSLAAITWREARSGAIRVWDLRTNRELYTIEVPDPNVSGAMAFSPDGLCLVATNNRQIHVWDARTATAVQTVDQPGGLAGLTFSPDGRRLAGAEFYGKRVKVFDWDSEKLTETRSLDGHRAPVVAVAYSSDGKYLASGDEEAFKVWDAQTLDEIRTVRTPAWQLAFAADSHTVLASMTTDRLRTVHTFTRWAVDDKESFSPFSVDVSGMPDCAFPRLSRDGNELYLGRRGTTTCVQVINTATGKERFPRQGHEGALRTVAVSPDGRLVASAGDDQVIKLWDLATRRVIRSLKPPPAAVSGLCFSPDGRQLVSGSDDGTIVFWSLETGTVIRTSRGDADTVSHIQLSPDGHLLAAGGQGGLIKLWDASTGNVRDSLPGHTGVVRCVAFSADGQWLASGGEDRTILVYPLAGGHPRVFRTPTAVNDVAFCSDGRTLAAVGDAQAPRGIGGPAPKATVHLWDLETARETVWEGHTYDVHALAFSPTAPLIATCGEDGTVRLWDQTGSTPAVWSIGPGPFGGPVRSVAFTPDGRYVATANANGLVYLLRVTGRDAGQQ
jgi:WD40 repeat protein/serine/threonine protein kinase